MRYEWKQVPYRTEQDIKKADRLSLQGWYVIAGGFNTVLLERPVTCEDTNKSEQ